MLRNRQLFDCFARRCACSSLLVEVPGSIAEFAEKGPASASGLIMLDFETAAEANFLSLKNLKADENPLPVVLVTTQRSVRGHRNAYQAGVHDIFAQDCPLSLFFEVIESALAENERRRKSLEMRTRAIAKIDRLSPTQARVANRLADGATLAEIANAEGVTVQSVSRYRRQLFEQLGVTSAVATYKLLKSSRNRKLAEPTLAYPQV